VRERKTDRVYGAVRKAIRRTARRGLAFDTSDINHDNSNGVRRALAQMVKIGYLLRIHQGRGAGDKSLYQIL